MHKLLIDHIIESNDVNKLKKLAYESQKLLSIIKEYDEVKYDSLEMDIYEIAFGKQISEEMAHEWVNNMKPFGRKWTAEETTSLLRQKNINLD